MTLKDVQYGLDIVGEMPERDFRPSVLEDTVTQIKNGAAPVGQAVIIARYRNRTAASAAANTLRKRHGRPDAEGFKFECHRVDDRSALFVVYNPEWVTPEGQAQHSADLDADKAKKADQARARRQKKADEKAAEAAAPVETKGKQKVA